MQNGTVNTMLKMVCVFSENKNDCQKQRKKHGHLQKREFKTKTVATALQQSRRWAFKFWGAGLMSHVNWALYCLKILK